MVQCRAGFAVLVEQADEAAADDGTGGVPLRGFQCLAVADAEADHARVGQSHAVYAVEVGLFFCIERFLHSGGGSGRHHVDEAVGVLVDEADALLAGFGG